MNVKKLGVLLVCASVLSACGRPPQGEDDGDSSIEERAAWIGGYTSSQHLGNDTEVTHLSLQPDGGFDFTIESCFGGVLSATSGRWEVLSSGQVELLDDAGGPFSYLPVSDPPVSLMDRDDCGFSASVSGRTFSFRPGLFCFAGGQANCAEEDFYGYAASCGPGPSGC